MSSSVTTTLNSKNNVHSEHVFDNNVIQDDEDDKFSSGGEELETFDTDVLNHSETRDTDFDVVHRGGGGGSDATGGKKNNTNIQWVVGGSSQYGVMPSTAKCEETLAMTSARKRYVSGMDQEMPQSLRKRIVTWLKSNLLLILTFGGVSLGVISGYFLRYANLDLQSISYIAYPGELFMRLLKLMILPLIIASLITGSACLNARMNGMIALKTMLYFIVTSLISSVLGLVLVVMIHPGTPETKVILGAGTTESRNIEIVDNFMDLGRNLIPDNVFTAAFETAYTSYDTIESFDGPNSTSIIKIAKSISYRRGVNTLGIIAFCLAFGTVLGSSSNPKSKAVIDFFSIIDDVIMRMVYSVMWISPIGICSVICAKILSVANIGFVMSQLGLFIITVVIGLFIYQFVIMQLIYFIFVKKNPFIFWWGLFQSWMTAFATASTAAALPITFRCMNEKNGVDPRISKFVLPIGATVNMDGTALFVTVASIFIAQMNSIELDAGQYVTIILTSTAASIASASVPSAALVLMLIVLSAINAPYQDVSLLWAIDWFVDRCRTTNNALGDCYAAAVIESMSKSDLDEMDNLMSSQTSATIEPNATEMTLSDENSESTNKKTCVNFDVEANA